MATFICFLAFVIVYEFYFRAYVIFNINQIVGFNAIWGRVGSWVRGQGIPLGNRRQANRTHQDRKYKGITNADKGILWAIKINK